MALAAVVAGMLAPLMYLKEGTTGWNVLLLCSYHKNLVLMASLGVGEHNEDNH